MVTLDQKATLKFLIYDKWKLEVDDLVPYFTNLDSVLDFIYEYVETSLEATRLDLLNYVNEEELKTLPWHNIKTISEENFIFTADSYDSIKREIALSIWRVLSKDWTYNKENFMIQSVNLIVRNNES